MIRNIEIAHTFEAKVEHLGLEDSFLQARFCVSHLKKAGFETYIVGGAVRDLLLGHRPKDFDLSTNATPEQVLEIFGSLDEIKQAKFFAASQAYPVVQGEFFNGHKLEIATFRKDLEVQGRHNLKIEPGNLEDDLGRRDFTINALALDPESNQIIDYHGGIDDLHSGIIRFVGDPKVRIAEDPLRIIRAVRFLARLDFQFADETRVAIEDAVEAEILASIVDGRRIGNELNQMLLNSNRIRALVMLDILGILNKIFPELSALHGVEQSPDWHAEGDVWLHTMYTLKHLGPNPSANLVWAMLLHDLGKPNTQTLPSCPGERIRFNGHAEIGAALAETFLKDRFRFGNKVGDAKTINRDFVAWMIANHMKIKELPQMKTKTAKEMLNHPAFPDLLKLHYADSCGSWRTLGDGTIEQDFPPASFYEVANRWKQHQAESFEQQKPSLKRDLGIDGDWLMIQLDLKPGPIIGQLLCELEEKYIEGELSTQEEALDFAYRKILQATNHI